jgi:hypothetical protein
MCLETLEGIKEIGGFKIGFWPEEIDPWSSAPPIVVNKNTNSIGFTLQNGPIKEVGVNGCQVDTMIEAAKLIIEKFDEKSPCEENTMVLMHLRSALIWLDTRKKNREVRGVEGTSET